MRVFWRKHNPLYLQKGKGVNSGTFPLNHGWNEIQEKLWLNVSSNPLVVKYLKSGIIELGSMKESESIVPLKHRLGSGKYDNVDIVEFLGLSSAKQVKIVAEINLESKLVQLRDATGKTSKIRKVLDGRIDELNTEVPVKEITSIKFGGLDIEEQKTIVNGSMSRDSLNVWKKQVSGNKEIQNLIIDRIKYLDDIDQGVKSDPALKGLNRIGE